MTRLCSGWRTTVILKMEHVIYKCTNSNHPYILYEPVPQLHGAKLKISCHEPHAEACSNLEEDLVFPLTQVNYGNIIFMVSAGPKMHYYEAYSPECSSS